MLQLADVDFADQRRDVLIVLVARFGFGDANLAQLRRIEFDNFKFGDVTAKLVEALHSPW